MWTQFFVNTAANVAALTIVLGGIWLTCKWQDIQYEKRKREVSESE